MSAKAKFAINLPQFHPEAPDELSSLGLFAEAAERLGFDSIWTLDRVFHKVPFLEPLTSLAYVAAKTTTVGIGTAILMTPLRTPSILAKTAATLDFLSGERLILGIALGGHPGEYAASGVPVKERVTRFLEGVQIMRMLWTQDEVDFQGRFWRLNHASISPRPARPGGIPLWMGGSQVGSRVNDAAIRRAAKLADGWLGAGSTTLEGFEDAYRRFLSYASEFGRDLEQLTAAKRVYIHVDPDRERARTVLQRALSAFYGGNFDIAKLCVYGGDQECAEHLGQFVEAGAKTLILHPVADHRQQAEVLARDVIAKLR